MNNNVKSATTAGLLGIFLGSVGAHDWYLGNKKKGIIHVCLAASGFLVFLIASVILPSALSYRALLSWTGLISVLAMIATLMMSGNGIWGFVEGIMILTQGDAGLAKKGYNVANQNMNYGNNNFGAQQGNNFGMQNMNNMNGMSNANGMNNMNGANNMNNVGMQNNMNQNNGGQNMNNMGNVNNGQNNG